MTGYGIGVQLPSVRGKCRVHWQVQLEARKRRSTARQTGGTEAAESVGSSVKKTFDRGELVEKPRSIIKSVVEVL